MVEEMFAEALARAARGDEAGALELCRKVLAAEPRHFAAKWVTVMSAIPKVYASTEELSAARQAFATGLDDLDKCLASGIGRHQALMTPFFLAYQEENNRELFARYGELCVRAADPLAAPPPSRRRSDRLRLAVVNAHVWAHSVWVTLLHGIVRHLDVGKIEIGIFYPALKSDAWTGFARIHAAHFQQGLQPPRAWAESILAWQPDVVLYPEIGMDLATAYLASLRLAETQVAMWGHPHTTGLPTIDYFLSAEALEPPDAEEHYTERLIQLPRLGCCFAPAQVTPTAVDLDALGIKTDRPLLLSPGMPQKYLPQHDWVFPEIAHRLGRCSIAFFTDDEIRPLTDVLYARIAAAFAARGMAFSDYCVVLPWQKRGPYFGLMRRAEVMLDTIGFSGFNTAMQAVECGLPIVTQEGRFMRGRFASGILRSIGLDELVAADAQQYVDLAVAVATDRERRASLRRRMEDGRGPLFNDREVVSALEKWLLGLVRK